VNYLSRIFLNKKIGMAAMQTTADTSSRYVDCSFTLSDCNRQINIDLSSSNVKEFNEKQEKLRKIIYELVELQLKLNEFKQCDEFKKMFK
jgi:predicted secreted protein